MSNYYWLKLHFDLLDDWKVGMLPDSLKWRFIQCLLVAGEAGEDGWLPPLPQFAFRIRPMTPESLQADLARLAASELLELRVDDDGNERWFVTNYQKRQDRKTGAERVRAYRERQREQGVNVTEKATAESRKRNAVVTARYTDKNKIENKKRKEQETRARANGRVNGFWDIPPTLKDSTPFIAAWGDWLKYVDEAGVNFVETQAQAVLGELAAMGPARATRAIRESIRRGWRSVYEPKNGNSSTAQPEPILTEVEPGSGLY